MGTPKVISVARMPRNEGLYFRVGHNDHAGLSRLVAERKLHVDGVVMDARRHDRHASFRQQAEQSAIATCLDTQAMELALPGTSSKGHSGLPWVGEGIHSPEDFSPQYVERFVDAIAERVTDGKYAEVMAPTHYIGEEGSAWLDVDERLTRSLRARLNATGQAEVRITYPLAVHHKVFYDREARALLRRPLASLPIDAVSLRVQPFGNHSGPLVLRNFVEACWDFPIATPLMIERAGFSGLAAFALGTVDVVESGITIGDTFDVSRLQRSAPRGRAPSFSPPQRMFVEALAATVDCSLAAKLMTSGRGKTYLACRDRSCCPNGFRDMLNDPHRHSALARQRQYAELSRVPRAMRAEYFLQNIAGPVCDMLFRAGTSHKPFRAAHRRMMSVKDTLADLQQEQKRQRGEGRLTRGPSAAAPTGAEILLFTPGDSRGR